MLDKTLGPQGDFLEAYFPPERLHAPTSSEVTNWVGLFGEELRFRVRFLIERPLPPTPANVRAILSPPAKAALPQHPRVDAKAA